MFSLITLASKRDSSPNPFNFGGLEKRLLFRYSPSCNFSKKYIECVIAACVSVPVPYAPVADSS